MCSNSWVIPLLTSSSPIGCSRDSEIDSLNLYYTLGLTLLVLYEVDKSVNNLEMDYTTLGYDDKIQFLFRYHFMTIVIYIAIILNKCKKLVSLKHGVRAINQT